MFGSAAIRTFHRLFSEGLVSLIATDAHSFQTDGWTFQLLLEALEGQLSDGDLVRLTTTNPRRLMRGEPLEPVVSGVGGQTTAKRKRPWGKG